MTTNTKPHSDDNPTSSDWATTRGDKWRARLTSMEAMLAPVDEPLLHALRLDAPMRIADVACGGGGTTLKILRRAPPGSVIHGFDISPGLVEAARARIPPDARALSFMTADVATTPPPGPPYERLGSRFGVMFFEDETAAFRNLAGWLVPGGRFAFAVWGQTADNPWRAVVHEVVARFIDLPAPDTEGPGPARYGQVDKLLALLGQAGFGEVEARAWRGAIPLGGGLAPAEATDFALAALPVSDPVAQADEAVRGDVRRALTECFSHHLRDGVVQLEACVHLVSGVRAK